MYSLIPSLNVTLFESLSDSNATNGTHLDLLGYLGMVVASVLWGANNLPIKHYETGDGKLKNLNLLQNILKLTCYFGCSRNVLSVHSWHSNLANGSNHPLGQGLSKVLRRALTRRFLLGYWKCTNSTGHSMRRHWCWQSLLESSWSSSWLVLCQIRLVRLRRTNSLQCYA